MAKVFISYDYDKDKDYKNMIVAWSKNNKDHFKNINFEDGSTDVSVNSTDKAAIKRAISRRMGTCDKFILLIGKSTHKSTWCKWEIEKAIELELDLIAVKIENTNTSPTEILGVGAKWAKSFTLESISSALK